MEEKGREEGEVLRSLKKLRDILTKAIHGPCLDSDEINPNIR